MITPGPVAKAEPLADATEGSRPLFILSPRERDALFVLAARLGWKPTAARQESGAESRFLGSLARVALVDLRGADRAEAERLVLVLSGATEATGAALLILVDASLEGAVPALIELGATHFLDGEISETRLSAGLSMAAMLPARLTGNLAADRSRYAIQREDALFWRWNETERTLAISPALDRLLGHVAPGADHSRWTISDFVRRLPRADRAGAVAAIRQAVDELMPSAFAHDVPGEVGRRLVQHVYPDSSGFSGEVEELVHAGRHDVRDRDFLTGLVNRRGAVRWLEATLARSASPATLLLSLEGFERVNSAYGRIVGDAMLSRVATRMTRLVQAAGYRDALVSRLTGAEFMVGFVGLRDGPEFSVEQAGLLARALVAEISRPFSTGDHIIRLSGRCGIAIGQAQEDAERLLRRGVAALAEARRSRASGSIRIMVSDGEGRAMDEDRLQDDLRRALDNGEIQILFQPQYAMANDSLIGVEALARWNHPQYGEIGASALFGLAERSDFLLPLSAHIHARTLAEAAAWPQPLRQLRLALNVTAADIAEPGFVASFLDLIDRSGFARNRLTVELTESGLVESLDSAAALLESLRQAGLAVAIDDFGTGYSSLAYLKSLPLDYLKIDAMLARDIVGSQRDRVVVRAIIDMARSLELGVIAEGVETEQQLALLARAGVHVYQGFLRSPAVTSNRLAQLVSEE